VSFWTVNVRSDRFAFLIILLWSAIYTWRGLIGHYALDTSAFDLSVFDYALWSLRHGGLGYVPFLGHSIFSHHFMPLLALLVPLYAVFESPVFLLVLQILVTAGAGLAFFVFQRRIGVEAPVALALLTVFLFARRTHGAVAGSFYPECFQALLTFAVVLAWPRGRWSYWLAVAALLATKEDAAIYLASFAAATLFSPLRDRLRTVGTIAVAVIWIGVALFIAIPMSRSSEGLSTTNPLLAGRYGSPEGKMEWPTLVNRIANRETAARLVNLMASTGGLSLVAPFWLLPATPALVVNLAADPETMQSALTGHYAWPVLPWMFIAAAAGTVRLARRSRRLVLVWVGVLVAATLADNPALQRLHRTRVPSEARDVRESLRSVRGSVILAQPNLIPHLPHQSGIFATGGAGQAPRERPNLVLLTEVGNGWPMTRDQVAAEVRRYDTDPGYERLTPGPLHAFRLRGAPSSESRK
jgi:uncharacterized membrane protein